MRNGLDPWDLYLLFACAIVGFVVLARCLYELR